MPTPDIQRQKHPQEIKPNHQRGIAAALLFGSIGFLSPIIIVLSFTAFRWIIEGASDDDRAADIRRLPDQLVFIVVGTAFVFSAAGYATYASLGKHRFAWTLLKIFCLSVAAWLLLAALGMPRPRYKIADHPLIYPTEFLVLALPPLLIAVILTWIRRSKSDADK